VARYGGDEFAIMAVDADERKAAEVTVRALDGVAQPATAGVAQWRRGEKPAQLIERADRALLYAKQQGERGRAMPASLVPEDFQPAAAERAPVQGRFTRP
jgi:PleD family two-component response regulator